MKLPCAVTRDLLPLYTEKMLESETTELVQAHLADCPGCRQKLSELNADTTPPAEATRPLKALKKELQTRRWFTAAVAALCVFIAVYAFFYQADSKKPVPWAEGLIEVQGVERRPYHEVFEHEADPAGSEEEAEVLVLQVDSRLSGFQQSMFHDDADGTSTLLLRGWSSQPLPADMAREYSEQVFYPVPDRVIYQSDHHQQLLWGQALRGGVAVAPRLALAYYVLIAAMMALLSGMLWFVLRKRQQSWIPRQIFFAPISYLAAHLLIKGTHTASFFMQRDLLSILLIASALYAAITLSWQLWLRRRNEA